MGYYYTVYGKDDAVIACGTSRECAEQLDLTLPSFYSTISRYKKERSIISIQLSLSIQMKKMMKI